MTGSWTCHHCEVAVPADRTTWWSVTKEVDGEERQHVYCSEAHADAGCTKKHPA